ncbi:MAG: carbon storage regulator [Thiogranum sp.]|nr:carbon storage regulator [Thiogranum sp.]
MLILTRRVGETLFINLAGTVDPATPVGELFTEGSIEVAILGVKGNQVRVGLQASKQFNIVREELVQPSSG